MTLTAKPDSMLYVGSFEVHVLVGPIIDDITQFFKSDDLGAFLSPDV